jgi:excisionase family DNA binding protein
MLATDSKPRRRTAAHEYYTVAEAQAILRYSKATMYRKLRTGEIPSRGAGRLRRIPRWALEMPQEPTR